MPNKMPIVHKAVVGRPRIIISPKKNCKNAVKRFNHQTWTIPLVWNANAAVAILSNIKYTAIVDVNKTRLNTGYKNNIIPQVRRISPMKMFKNTCLIYFRSITEFTMRYSP